MFRERTHVRTGCERCKARKKKCDEQRPRCGYCTRWDLSCNYLSANTSVIRCCELRQRRARLVENDHVGRDLVRSIREALPTIQVRTETIIYQRPATTGALDPFNLLPIPDAQHQREINHKLWTDFSNIIQALTPFDVQLPRRSIAHEYFEAMQSDPAVCCAIFSFAAAFESSETQDRASRVFSLEFQTRTEQLIQAKINQGGFLENNLLLATSMHLIASAIENYSPAYILRLVNGIKAMINLRSGSGQTSANLPFHIIASLVVADNIVSRYTAGGPFLIDNYPEPRRPRTLDRYSIATTPTILDHWDFEVINVLEALKFLLLFREPAFVARKLSKAESWYLIKLEIWIDVRLNCLQTKHLGIGDVSEIATLTLLMFTIEVVVDLVQNIYINVALLKRMQSAVRTYLDTVHEMESPNNMIVWTCIVAAAGPDLASERRFFWETLHNLGLKTGDEVLSIVTAFAWHECLNHALLSYEQLFP